MLLTNRRGPAPAYIGVDLTDGYSESRRPVDVCGLTPSGQGFEASFWTWTWRDGDLDSVVAELTSARCALIDGPQALARPGASLRECERLTATPGKTPARREDIRGPYAPYVRSSVDFFRALAGAGVPISLDGFVGGVGEVYPGNAWKALLPGIAKKATAAGLAQRASVLEGLGIRLAICPTHDQLDAALGALIAAAADGRIPGIRVIARGLPLVRRADGDLEEGPIAVPALGEDLVARLRGLAAVTSPTVSRRTATGVPSAPPTEEFPCPIPGCVHVFRGSRGGWDAHVGSLRKHPAWRPHLGEAEARRAAFKRDFLEFFER